MPKRLFWFSHPYTGNLNSETSGDSENALWHCEDVSALVELHSTASTKLTRLPLSLLLVRSITAECPA